MTRVGNCESCGQTSSTYGLTVKQYSCNNCSKKYCEKCGSPCPKCGSKDRVHYEDFMRAK